MLDKEQLGKAFGNRVRSIVSEKKLRPSHVAKNSGLWDSTVWSLYWFGGNPTLYSVYKMAKALGVSMSELVGGLDE